MSAWGSIDPVLDEDLAKSMRPRRWHWLVLLGVLILVGLLILTPPMLNVNRYQRRNTPRSGYTREASLEPPALPKKLSQKMTEGYTPEEIQAARPAAPSPNLKGRPLFEPGYDPNFVPSLFGKTPK